MSEGCVARLGEVVSVDDVPSHSAMPPHFANFHTALSHDAALSARTNVRMSVNGHETDMPKYLGDVRCWVNSGKHMLAWSFSGFDPIRKSTLVRQRPDML
jgi:hypothetical protein